MALEKLEGPLVFNSKSQALIFYLQNVSTISAGLLILLFSHGASLFIFVGIFISLIGIWQFLTTKSVFETDFVITEEEIYIVKPIGPFALKWNDIKEVIIRERKAGSLPWRPLRLLVFIKFDDEKFSLITSILSQNDEDLLLSQIKHRIHCPIRIINDGIILSRPWRI